MNGNEGIEVFAREYRGTPRYWDIHGNSHPFVVSMIDGICKVEW